MSGVARGCVLAEHVHTGLELTYVVEGSLEDDEGVCRAGDFVWRPPGSRHQARTPNGAKFLVRFRGGARSVETGRMLPNFDEQSAAAALSRYRKPVVG